MAALIGFGLSEGSSVSSDRTWWGVGIGLTLSLGVSAMEFMNGNYLEAGIFGLVVPLGAGLLMRIHHNIIADRQLDQRADEQMQVARQAIQIANLPIDLMERPQIGLTRFDPSISGG